jgi:hypothetical protein
LTKIEKLILIFWNGITEPAHFEEASPETGQSTSLLARKHLKLRKPENSCTEEFKVI